MNLKKIIIPVIVIIVISNLSLVWFVNRKVDKIVVVDVLKVFNEYKLKKEIEQKVDDKLRLYKDKIDSVQAIYKIAMDKHDEARIEKSKEVLYQLQLELQNSTDVSVKNINEVVWKRLNPLIDEFGAKNHYRLIIGANGMGTVLYNETAMDKTSDLIKFINNKYETGN